MVRIERVWLAPVPLCSTISARTGAAIKVTKIVAATKAANADLNRLKCRLSCLADFSSQVVGWTFIFFVGHFMDHAFSSRRVGGVLRFAAALILAGFAFLTSGAPAFAQIFDAGPVEIEDVVGFVSILVEDRSNIEVVVGGEEEAIARVTVSAVDGVVKIFYEREVFDNGPKAQVTVRMPAGNSVAILAMTGEVDIGDINAMLFLNGRGSVRGSVGTIASGFINIGGAGDLKLGDVNGALSVDISGAGKLAAGVIAGTLFVDISGSGSVTAVSAQALDVEISGNGDVIVEEFAGPSKLDVRGNGFVVAGL